MFKYDSLSLHPTIQILLFFFLLIKNFLHQIILFILPFKTLRVTKLVEFTFKSYINEKLFATRVVCRLQFCLIKSNIYVVFISVFK